MSILSCCAPLPDYALNPCEIDKLSGIGEVAIVCLDHQFTDFEDPAQWTAEIAAGRAKVIKGIQAEKPAAEPVTAAQARARGFETKVVKMNQTLTWVDQNVSDQNDQFYEGLNVQTAYIVWNYFEEGEIRVQAAFPCQFVATPAVATNNEFQRYEVTASWRSSPNVFPVLLNTPAGIFD